MLQVGNSTQSRHAQGRSKGQPAAESVRGVQEALHVAQGVGELLGGGETALVRRGLSGSAAAAAACGYRLLLLLRHAAGWKGLLQALVTCN